MARLNKTPSQPSNSPRTATQQLHTKSLASQTLPAQPSSAVHGAALLSAAQHIKPTDVTCTAKGKLPRPTLKPKTATKKPVIRSDIYDLPRSPVNQTSHLPHTLNPAPPKAQRRNKKVEEEEDDYDDDDDDEARSRASSELQEPQSENSPLTKDKDKPQILTSPPIFAKGTSNHVHVEEHHMNGNKRKLEVGVDLGGCTFKSQRLAESDAFAASNRQKALSSPLIQSHTSRPSRRSHPEVRVLVKKTKTRSLSMGAGAAGAGKHSGNSHHEGESDTISVAIPEPFAASSHSASRHQAIGGTPSTSISDVIRQQGEYKTVPVEAPNPSAADNLKKSTRQATQISAPTSDPIKSTRSDQSKRASASTSQKNGLPITTDDVPMLGDRGNGNETENNEVFEIQQELEGDKQNREIARSRRALGSASAPPASTRNKKTRHIPIPQARTNASRRTTKDGQQAKIQSARKTGQGPDQEEHEENNAGEAAGLEEQVSADKDSRRFEKASEQDATLTDLDRVFNFLDAGERSGKCQTKLATLIKRACDRACSLVSEEIDSIDIVVENNHDVRAMLGRTGSLEEDKQVAFKLDAYSFLFRALTLYLEAVHDCLSKYYDEATESLSAMQIFHSLVKDILMFKAKISSWNAPVPQYRDGERLIKDVNSKLIVPLRKVERSLDMRIRSLEVAEKKRQVLLESERKHEEEIARQDYLTARKERRKRWQDLHIARMQCEPDLYRRRKLFLKELDDLEETDANGVKFERIPLFKDRVMPRATSSTLEQREWTDEQTAVLIEALEKFAGPRVFEKLFHAHCRPDGMLRDFTVTDITAKAAWVRSAYLKLHQEQQDKGWEVPDWVKQIPVLP